MAVAKGIKSQDGQTYLIEGAGSVYNEQLNSVAFGEETVAEGRNQFVFGRLNPGDSIHAEIVGGGKAGRVLNEITVESLQSVEVGDIFKVKFNRSDWWNGSTFEVLAKSLSDFNSALEPVGHHVGFGVRENGQVFESTTPAGFTFLFGGRLQTDPSSWSLYCMVYVYRGVIYADHSVFVLQPASEGDTKKYLLNKDLLDNYALIGGEIVGMKKDIRTLGWDGTQWNAGDITCDDGEGGIISLRELASNSQVDVSGKANKVASATAGHVATLTAGGDLQDSGYAVTDFATYSTHINFFAPQSTQIMFWVTNGVVSLSDESSVIAAYNELLNLGMAAIKRCAVKIGIMDTVSEDVVSPLCLCDVSPEDETQQVARFYLGNHNIILMRQGQTLSVDTESVDALFAAQL